VWLAQKGFSVTGIDVSEQAIRQAGQRAAKAGAECGFLVGDFMVDAVPGAPFRFIFDRGCFHSYRTDEGRRVFAERVWQYVDEEGLWLSLMGSADDPPRQHGPPMLTAREIVVAVEPYFELLSLTSGHFDSDRSIAPRAWVCLMRRRDEVRLP
jgi:hypothetical protein